MTTRRFEMRGIARSAARLLAFGALAVLLTGCLKLDMALDVKSNDTVDGSIIFAINKQLADLAGGDLGALTGDQGPLPSGVDAATSDYEDDTFKGTKYTFEDVPLDQFNTPDDAEALNIVHAGDTFQVSGVLDLTQGTDTSGLPGGEQLLQGAEIRVALTFPGDVSSSNGQIDGNTVTWEPKLGERVELQATASAIESSSGVPWLWIGIGAVVVALVIVGVVLAGRSKPGSVEPEGSSSDAGAPAPPPVVGEPEGASQAPPPPPSTEPPPMAAAPGEEAASSEPADLVTTDPTEPLPPPSDDGDQAPDA